MRWLITCAFLIAILGISSCISPNNIAFLKFKSSTKNIDNTLGVEEEAMTQYYELEINSSFFVGVGNFLPDTGNEIVMAFENGSVKIFDYTLKHTLASYNLGEQFSLLYVEHRECFSGDVDGDGLDEPIFWYDIKIAIINYNDQIMKIEVPSAQYEGRTIDKIFFVKDLDGDGKCDIVFGLMTSDWSYHDSIGVLWGDDLSMDIRVFNTTNTQIGGCVAGDFNGDGSQDLLLYCLEEGIGGNLYLLNSSTLGTIGSWFISSSGSYDVLKVNINNDSRDDFVLYSYTSVISYTWNISTGNPIKVSSINTTLGFYVEVGNEDYDETNELILINGSSTYSQWEAIYWDPNGTVINRMNVQTDGISIQDFTICLANNDDKDDIAIFMSDDYRTFIRLFDSRDLDKIGEVVKYIGNLGDYVFLGYDLNNDSAEDLLCLYGEYNHYFLLVLLSDSNIPSLTGFRIYPEHPTIYDGFIQASVYVQDNQGIKEVKFECSYDGGVSWEEVSCYADPENPSLYKAFIPGPSKGGWITVKVSVYDSFMNVLVKEFEIPVLWYIVVNADLPVEYDFIKVFDVNGDNITDFIGAYYSDYYSDKTLISVFDGCTLNSIYNISLKPRGRVLIYPYHNKTKNYFDILVVVLYPTEKSGILIFDGETGSLYFNMTPVPNSSQTVFAEPVDVNNDGVSELLIGYQNESGYSYIRLFDMTSKTFTDRVPFEPFMISETSLELFADAIRVGEKIYKPFYHTEDGKFYFGIIEISSSGLDIKDKYIVDNFNPHGWKYGNFTTAETEIVIYGDENGEVAGFYVINFTNLNVKTHYTISSYYPGSTLTCWTGNLDDDNLTELVYQDYLSLNITIINFDEPSHKSFNIVREVASVYAFNMDTDDEDEILIFTSSGVFYYDLRTGSMNFIIAGIQSFDLAFRGEVTGDEFQEAIFYSRLGKILGVSNYKLYQMMFVSFSFPNNTLIQGDYRELTIRLWDIKGEPITDASPYMFVTTPEGKVLAYAFANLNNGTYYLIFSTTNLKAGSYNYTIHVYHSRYVSEDTNGNFTIIGRLKIRAYASDKTPYQNSEFNLSVQLYDAYNNPIEDANVTVEFVNANYTPVSIENNTYHFRIVVGNLTHGTYNLYIKAGGHYYIDVEIAIEIVVEVRPPEIKLEYNTFMMLIAASFGISATGLFLYYKVSSMMRRIRRLGDISELKRTLKLLDILYFSCLFGFSGVIGLSYVFYSARNYPMAVGLLSLSLMIIILLYAIWLYRDIHESIVGERTPILRIISGLWHLIIVPLIIYLIIYWGENIEWFAVYILEDIVDLKIIKVPSILISLLMTYISSFFIVVIFMYRDMLKIKKKIKNMRDMNAPEDVIVEEKEFQIGKLTSSLRNRFIAFLFVVGFVLVSTAKLFRYYELGIVLLIPIVLLVGIPYITNKLFSLFTRKKS